LDKRDGLWAFMERSLTNSSVSYFIITFYFLFFILIFINLPAALAVNKFRGDFAAA
jgi:hypothetical protein